MSYLTYEIIAAIKELAFDHDCIHGSESDRMERIRRVLWKFSVDEAKDKETRKEFFEKVIQKMESIGLESIGGPDGKSV